MAEQLDIYAAWKQLAAKAWSDPALKAKLLANPAEVLKAIGVTVPAGITVKVVENTEQLVHLVLPAKEAPAELSDEELHQVAAGGQQNWPYRDNDPNDGARVPPGTYRDNDPNDAARN
jgi:hypothetical protein